MQHPCLKANSYVAVPLVNSLECNISKFFFVPEIYSFSRSTHYIEIVQITNVYIQDEGGKKLLKSTKGHNTKITIKDTYDSYTIRTLQTIVRVFVNVILPGILYKLIIFVTVFVTSGATTVAVNPLLFYSFLGLQVISGVIASGVFSLLPLSNNVIRHRSIDDNNINCKRYPSKICSKLSNIHFEIKEEHTNAELIVENKILVIVSDNNFKKLEIILNNFKFKSINEINKPITTYKLYETPKWEGQGGRDQELRRLVNNEVTDMVLRQLVDNPKDVVDDPS